MDFYHALSKLVLFGNEHFKVESVRKKWIEDMKQKLLNNQVLQVIEQMNAIKTKNLKAKNYKNDLLNYYEEHEDKMMYKTYKEFINRQFAEPATLMLSLIHIFAISICKPFRRSR